MFEVGSSIIEEVASTAEALSKAALTPVHALETAAAPEPMPHVMAGRRIRRLCVMPTDHSFRQGHLGGVHLRREGHAHPAAQPRQGVLGWLVDQSDRPALDVLELHVEGARMVPQAQHRLQGRCRLTGRATGVFCRLPGAGARARETKSRRGLVDRDAGQWRLGKLTASDSAPTRMRLKAQVALRLNQLCDTNLRPKWR